MTAERAAAASTPLSSTAHADLGTWWRVRLLTRAACVTCVLVSMLIALMWPMLFTTSGFGGDWEHHLWFVWHQSLEIRADGSPSMFLNTRTSILYPLYAFYGGTIYALSGTLALALGNSPISAYVLTYMLGFIAAYGGWYWIARAAGLGRWWAQVPGLLFVTAAYYLTLAYGQGDWPELIALSALPLMIASGLAVLRAEHPRLLPVVALAGSAIVFFGSHILTVLWGSTLLVLVCIPIVALVPEWRGAITRRGVLRLLAVIVPAGLTNAWFLAPMTAYSSHTLIGSDYSFAFQDLRATMHLVAFTKLFTFSRASAITEPDYVLSLPTATIIWLLASLGVMLLAFRRSVWLRVFVVLATATVAIIVVMTHAGLVLALPKPYTLLQFSYRLEGYVLMTVTAAVLVVLAAVRSASTRWRLWAWTIVPVLVLSVIGGVEQVSAYPHTPQPRDETFSEGFEQYAELYRDYEDTQLPFLSEKHLAKLTIPLSAVHDDRASVSVRAARGSLLATNIGGAPDLLKITGASVVGEDQSAGLVLALGGEAPDVGSPTSIANVRVTVQPSQPAPVVAGRLLTFAALLILALEFAVLVLRSGAGVRDRARRARAPAPARASSWGRRRSRSSRARRP